MEISIKDITGLPEVARAFITSLEGRTVFAFDAPMGAGKTTFIAEVCRQLGVADHTGSPTFSIVNEYRDGRGEPVYHFDFYRLDSPQEALDLGAPDYFDSGCLCLIEWPDRIGSILPDDAVTVTIRVAPDGSRTFSF